MYAWQAATKKNIDFKSVFTSVPDDWEIPFEGISDLQWLGSGAQGAVFVGRFNNELVAVKKVKDSAKHIIHHLQMLNHSTIVHMPRNCTMFGWLSFRK